MVAAWSVITLSLGGRALLHLVSLGVLESFMRYLFVALLGCHLVPQEATLEHMLWRLDVNLRKIRGCVVGTPGTVLCHHNAEGHKSQGSKCGGSLPDVLCGLVEEVAVTPHLRPRRKESIFLQSNHTLTPGLSVKNEPQWRKRNETYVHVNKPMFLKQAYVH